MIDEEYEQSKHTTIGRLPAPPHRSRTEPKSAEAAAAGLPNTIYAVVIRKGSEVIGMGRIIGDRSLCLQIVDVAADPAHQKRDLGKRIVAALVDLLTLRLQAHPPRSIGMHLHFKIKAQRSLIAAKPSNEL